MGAKQDPFESNELAGLRASNPSVASAGGGRGLRAAFLAGGSLIALAALGAPGAANAACGGVDQTFSSSVFGPIFSTGGSIAVLSGVTISGGTQGVNASSCSISTLTNNGAITASVTVVYNNKTITTLTNNGIISRQESPLPTDAIVNDVSGLITMLNNAGAIIGANGVSGGVGGIGVHNFGTITTLTNSGTISGGGGSTSTFLGGAGEPGDSALLNRRTGTISALINEAGGTIAGGNGGDGSAGRSGGAGGAGVDNFANALPMGTIVSLINQAGGTIAGGAGGNGATGGAGVANNQAIGSPTVFGSGLANSGMIIGGLGGSGGGAGGAGVANGGTITTLTNKGTIAAAQGGRGSTGGAGGAGVANGGTITTLTNTAMIVGGRGGTGSMSGAGGAGGAGVSNSATIATLSNSGTISGGSGGPAGTFGLNGNGVSNFNEIGTLDNKGIISGEYGVFNSPTGSIGVFDNQKGGVINGTVAGLGNFGKIGAFTNLGTIDPGARAFAIFSTGSIGPITNGGQIIGNVEIDNQANVAVTGGSGRIFGSWSGGTITIGNGDLTFAGGNTALGDNVVVNGGGGTVFNDDPLMIAAPQTITGNYDQSAAGVLDFGIAGDMTGQYGSLAITGFATLDGGLQLDLLDGFRLAAGDVFDFLSYSGFSGGFSDVSVDGEACTARGGDVWTCNTGFNLDLGFGAGGLDVTVGSIPEPSTWALLATGFLGLAALGLRARWRVSAP